MMIPIPTLEATLARALRSGADYAELFAEDTLTNYLAMVDGRMEDALSTRIHGAGVRIFSGTRVLYAYTNDTSREGLLRVAGQVADALGEPGAEGELTLHGAIAPNINPVRILPSTVAGARKAAAVREVHQAIAGADPRIVQAQAAFRDVDQRVLIATSEGPAVEDRRVYSRLIGRATAGNGAENQTGQESPGGLCGLELLNRVDPGALGREAARIALTMLDAPACPGGRVPVIIDGGFGGVLFHEACAHGLEATSVARDLSVFCGRLGQRIASERVTAIDDGTMPNQWGSFNVDDEGLPGRRNVLIENGVLKGYMVDRLGARIMGCEPTGSGRRQSYRYAPTSRMTNTYIAAGNDDEAEILSSMPEGLYAKRMGGGSVDTVTGEFNFAVEEGYWVKNGAIDRPVRGATLIGKGAQVLLDIDRVGKRMWLAQGMCGSKSGSVPTSVGQPMIRVTAMTVGGR